MAHKRWGAIALASLMCMTAACGDDGRNNPPETNTSSAPITETSTSAAPTSATETTGASVTTSPVTAASTASTASTPLTTAAPAATTTAPTVTTAKATTTVGPTTTVPVTGTITVYAAASLTSSFTDLGKLFEQRNPGTSVKFSFAGSSTLVTQIFQGAPADVFASADQPNMDRLVDSGLMAGTPRIFTKNLLQIVVAKGNPKKIIGLADLARPDVVTVLCGATVPCGNYARQSLAKAGVTVNPKSNELSVTAVIGRVATGEADAGIGYVTDVLVDSRVDGVVIPSALNVVAEYPLAVLKEASNPTTAEAFVVLVRSPDGQAVMSKYGFLAL